jgi:hypothetical protein
MSWRTSVQDLLGLYIDTEARTRKPQDDIVLRFSFGTALAQRPSALAQPTGVSGLLASGRSHRHWDASAAGSIVKPAA